MARGNPLNLDVVGVFVGLGEVVLHLQAQPYVGAATEGIGKPYRHFRRDSGLAVHKVVEGLALDAKTFRRFRNGEAERLDALLPDTPAGMGGVFMVIASTVPGLSRKSIS